ncbi:hypothetical protein HYU06_04130 [Candidatus Woesearchaeota archaeon]|nr:hypothetical protein [Candidatus Woesearchaeota archaeon]
MVEDCTISDLEREIIRACLSVKDFTLAQREGIKNLGKTVSESYPDFKGEINPASVVTLVDMHNQEEILLHMAKYFPELYITVEENIGPEKQTVVQKQLYDNKDNARFLFALDALDGTSYYKDGTSDDYAVCAAILERTGQDACRFRLAIFYYPETGMFLIARGKNNVVEMDENGREQHIHVDYKEIGIETGGAHTFGTFQSHELHGDNALGFRVSNLFKNDGKAMAHDIQGLLMLERAGYVMKSPKVIDIGMGAYILDSAGFHVRYEDGTGLEEVMWGDRVKDDGTRELARLPQKILIAALNSRLYRDLVEQIDKNRLK